MSFDFVSRIGLALLACLALCAGPLPPAVAQSRGALKTNVPSKTNVPVKTNGVATTADAADGEMVVDAPEAAGDAELDESREIEAAAAKGDPQAKVKPKLKTVTQVVVKDPAMKYTDPRTYRVKVGFRVEASGGNLANVTAIGPIPIDWPEQEVRLVREKISPGARISQHVYPGQRAVLTMQAATIPQGETYSVERLYEITRYRMEFKLPPDELSQPKRTPAELRDQIAGIAPGLETKHPKIIALAASLQKESASAGPWSETHAFWAWTRDNIQFQRGDFRGALYAVENRCGDCEELSALFVSLCRLSNIAARTVWVDGTAAGHNYPEFYLVDKKGVGHWIPAQVVGPAWFGEMAEYRPIFQKGDRFYDPLQKEHVRYSPHTLRVGNGVTAKLSVIFEIVGDQDINGPSYNSTK